MKNHSKIKRNIEYSFKLILQKKYDSYCLSELPGKRQLSRKKGSVKRHYRKQKSTEKTATH